MKTLGGAEPVDPLQEFKSIVVKMGLLSQAEIDIYYLGLKEGTITTTHVSEAFPNIGQSTAGARLKQLSSKGFFLVTPHEGADKRSGRTHPRKYRAVAPSVALKDIFESHKLLQTVVDKLDEALEIKAEQSAEEEDMWLAKPQKLAISEGVSMLEGANASIDIFGRDCTWLSDAGITSAISKARARGAKVRVLATSPPHKSPGDGIRVQQVNSITTTPFCVIDNSMLLIPFKSGHFQSEYSLLVVKNKYVVAGFSQLFQGLYPLKSGDGKQ